MKSDYYKDLKIYNSLSGKKETFVSINKKNVGMYVCGPTVYSNAHLGNCRTFISFDLIRSFTIASNVSLLGLAILLN